MKKRQQRRPIDEIFKIARDQMWNPRLQPSKMPMVDVVQPNDRKPNPNPKAKPLAVIVQLVEEMQAAYGPMIAETYRHALLREAGLTEDQDWRETRDKLFDKLFDELDEE